MNYFEHRVPCDLSLIGKFRKLIGEEGVEELLTKTNAVTVNLRLISPKALETVLMDTTVRLKAVAYPTHNRLLEVCRAKLVGLSRVAGIGYKLTFAKEGKTLTRQASGYAHAEQFSRMRKPLRRQRTFVEKLMRSMQTKLGTLASRIRDMLQANLIKAQQLVSQTTSSVK